jgi:iron complex transport system ATP-binding protein
MTLTLTNTSIARGKRILCRELNFELNPGDFCAILGANGSGKSTLLQTLCRQLQPAQGEIRLHGNNLRSYRTRELAQHIGVLFQDTEFHFAQSVAEYCAAARFPHQSLLRREGAVSSALTQAVLDKMELTPLAASNIQALSGGEQRRAAIAALLVQTPQIYLLDEPANHLDLPHQIAVMQHLQALSRDHIVMASLHDINFAARYCNKVLLLFKDGSYLFGTTESLLTSFNLTRLYQYPIDALTLSDQTYWLPRQQTAPCLT